MFDNSYSSLLDKIYKDDINDDNYTIYVVGAGGKSSLIKKLATDLSLKRDVIIATTTKMTEIFPITTTFDEAKKSLNTNRIALVGKKFRNIKVDFPDLKLMDDLINDGGKYIFFEADGANRFPCKIPAEYEPVYYNTPDLIIVVMGLSALNKKAKDVCHRYTLGGLSSDDTIDEYIFSNIINEYYIDRIKLLFPKKNVIVVLNQIDCIEKGYELYKLISLINTDNVLFTILI